MMGHKQSRRAWSGAEVKRLRELWNKGASVDDIAVRFGRTVTAIRRQVQQQIKLGACFPRGAGKEERDILGQTFGRRTVIARAPSRSSRSAMWLVRCACGEESAVEGHILRVGRQGSCRKCAGRAPGKRNGPTPKVKKALASFAEIRARDRQIAARHAEAEAAFT